MQITLNGEDKDVGNGISIRDLLIDLAHDPDRKGIAVAVNAEIVVRTKWASRRLGSGDRVDIIAAVQGG
ncbi:MAG: sulfur carrier protein ThiS [Gemmatimonadota bacterium]|nr:sulfur carrier protein ThiS [Gemmatimonadota bacterium]